MAHMLVLVDGKPTQQEDFKRWVEKRGEKHQVSGVHKAWNPQIRELKMYDIVAPEKVIEDYASDIKAIKGYGGCLPSREKKINLISKWLSKLVGLKDMGDIKPTKEDVREKGCKVDMSHPFIVGLLEDPHYIKEKMKNRPGLQEGDEML